MIDFSTNLLKLNEEKMNNRTNKYISASKKDKTAQKKQIIKNADKNISVKGLIKTIFGQASDIKIYQLI